MKRTFTLLAGLILLFVACKKENHKSVTNSTVYIGSLDSNLYALDAQTGAKKWVFHSAAAIYSSPTIYKGLVYLAGSDGVLYGLDTATGAQVWAYRTGSPLGPTPIVSGGNMYFSNENDSLFALDIDSRSVLWIVRMTLTGGSPVSSSPTLMNGVLYVGGPGYVLMFAFDASTGNEEWMDSSFFDLAVYGAPCYSNGTVFVGGQDENLYALNATTGAVQWSYPTFSQIFSSPTVSNGLLYFGGTSNFIYCLDVSTAKEKWTYVALNAVYASPVVANGVVYVGDASGNLFALDANTGVPRWVNRIGTDNLFGGPTYANGTLYLGSLDQHVYAVDATTGNTKWAFLTNGSIQSSPCVTGSDGSVYHPGVSGEEN